MMGQNKWVSDTTMISSIQNESNYSSKIDSLNKLIRDTKSAQKEVNLLNNLAKTYYLNQSPIDGIKEAEKALKIAEENHFPDQINKSLSILGKLHNSNQTYGKALEYLQKAAHRYQNQSNEDSYWEIQRQIATVYSELRDFSQALKLYYEALAHFESNNDLREIAIIENNLGIVYHRGQDDMEEALKHYKRGFAAIEDSSEEIPEILIRLHTNVGLTYFEMGKYETAKQHFLQSLEINQKVEKNPYVQAVNKGNLGLAYSGLQAYSKSRKFFKEAITDSRNMQNQRLEAIYTGDLGRVYLKMAEETSDLNTRQEWAEKAIKHFQWAMNFFKEVQDFRRFQGYASELSKTYELMGDFEKALQSYKAHSYYKDSLFSRENLKELSKQETVYEYSKKMDSIRMENEKKLAIKDATLIANTRQKWLLGFGILLLAIIGGMLYYQNRQKKKNNQRLFNLNQKLTETNQLKIKFFGIINHDLRSPISDVIKLLRLKNNKQMTLDTKTQKRMESQTLESAEHLLATMDDLLLWSKGQMKNFKPRFENVSVDSLFEKIKHLFTGDQTALEFHNPKQLYLHTDPNFLKTILRNLTSNSLKAVEKQKKPKIIWRASEENNSKILSITDNGPGGTNKQFQALFDDSHIVGIKTGLGLHLIREMAQAIGCKIEVDSNTETGTTINLIFNKLP